MTRIAARAMPACFLAVFMLLGQLLLSAGPGGAVAPDEFSQQRVLQLDDDTQGGNDFPPAVLVACGAVAQKKNHALALTGSPCIRTDFRIPHSRPDTRGSPGVLS